MSKELDIFTSAEFGTLRTIEENGKIMFVASDVAKMLGYVRPADAVTAHCKVSVKYRLPTNGGVQEVKIISEGDVYRLIAHSKLPAAEKFESWVFDEVLPSIRKNGAYITPQVVDQLLADPDTMIKLLTNLKQERANRLKAEQALIENKPKIIFAEAVETAKTSILIGELAKIIKQNGIDTGEKRLFKWLREHGYLISRKGTDYNMPTQKSMKLGLFEIKERTIVTPNESTKITKTTKVTGKGQTYFINKFLNETA